MMHWRAYKAGTLHCVRLGERNLYVDWNLIEDRFRPPDAAE
jgi:hypothetical protein